MPVFDLNLRSGAADAAAVRRRVLIALLVALGVILLAPSPASAQVSPQDAEQDFVAHLNALRASRGLPALAVHDELTGIARSWATKMAAADRISHNANFAGSVQAPWQKLGENVGVGMTVEDVHSAFVASPAHLKNIVDPAFGYVGVGVAVGRDGALFTAHQFMQLGAAAASVPPAPTAPPTTAAPRAAAPPRPPATTVPKPTRVVTTAPPPVEVAVAVPEPPAPAPAAPPVGPPPPRLVLVLQLLADLDAA